MIASNIDYHKKKFAFGKMNSNKNENDKKKVSNKQVNKNSVWLT